jgi:fructokinase
MVNYFLIEGGGSWFRGAVAAERSPIQVGDRVDTTTPEATLSAVCDRLAAAGGKPDAIGLACFGPLDVDPRSPRYGRILDTPKEGWSGFDVTGYLRSRFGVPVYFHTDVVAAALGEWKEGAAKGAHTVLYLTVGTGIGGAALVSGAPVCGSMHAEMGHVSVRRDRGDRFPGVCPFHGDCIEGLASGPAIAKRALRKSAKSLPVDHPAYTRAMAYLAQAVSNFVLTLAPDIVVIGGGVMRDGAGLPLVRARVHELLRTYVPAFSAEAEVEKRIVSPGLEDRSALVGARELIAREIGRTA